LFALADKAGGQEKSKALIQKSRAVLMSAVQAGSVRSDFVALLARANSRLGEYAETAKLLDQVRITIWEGAREAHDLFEEAHLVLGKAHLEGGRPAEALREFDRALEYPENLATGKLQNTCESHIHLLRGQALAALGQQDAAKAAWQKAVAEPKSRDAHKEQARAQAKDLLEKAR